MKKPLIFLAIVFSVLAFGLLTFELQAFAFEVNVDEASQTTEAFKKVKEKEVYSAKISVVGDMMVHEWQLDDAYDKKSDSYDFNYTFEMIKKYIFNSDYAIGNLETTFAGKEKVFATYPTFNTPDSFGEAIKNAGFDLVTTANNHSNDKFDEGILRTLDVLGKLNLEHIGTYRSEKERDEILIKDINGIKFAFLSYSYGTNGISLAKGKWYSLNLLNEELITADIKRAKALNPDFIVVLPHMGNEYETEANETQKKWVETMFKAGADIVLASHPHVLQPMEFVNVMDEDGTERKCFVIYSLGNFVSSQRTQPRERSIILNMYFEKVEGEKAVIKDVSYVPTWVKFVSKKGAYDIKVLPVYDTIEEINMGVDTDLRPKDIQRVKQVSKEIHNIYNGQLSEFEGTYGEYFIR